MPDAMDSAVVPSPSLTPPPPSSSTATLLTRTVSPTSSYPAPGPAYKSVGDPALDMRAFFHILEKLKTQKRGGWVREGVKEPESIADHMYRMSVLALCVPNEGRERPLDVGKCCMMAVVHDLAEAHVGDITPVDGVSKKEKHRLEAEAMHSFLNEMLGGGEAAKRIGALWEEYEAGQTPEAKFVKDLDRFELVLQTVEYERSQSQRALAPFLAGSIPHIRDPAVQDWTRDVMAERKELYAERGEQSIEWQDAKLEEGKEPVVGSRVVKID